MQPILLPVKQVGLEQSIQQAMKSVSSGSKINLGPGTRQINALSQPLGKITGQADEFTKSMEAANARVFAFGASVGIINSVSSAFSALVKNTIATEKALTDININLNQSSAELDKFGNKLFDLAKSTGQSFQVVADGALELSRQGLNATDVIKRLNDALILSRLSGLDAEQSVQGLTAAINSFKDAGISSEQIVNKLVVVSQKYAVSERDLIEAIKRSASVADQAGVSLDELIGIVTTVQERTARGGAVIGNAFKTIFSRIQDKSALKDLQDLGIQVTNTAGEILPATSILQNLAKEFDSLSKLEQADIAKKLGGVYQLSNLLAAVKDLSSEQSKYTDIVKLSQGATDQAYRKNAALNETLASIINKVTVSAEQLGATLGKIGLTDSAKELLNFFGGLLDSIQQILGEQSAMGDFVRGLAKGIGSLITGPGLALFGAIIIKLSKDLAQFGFSSLKSFFGIGKAAKDIENIEKSINTALASNIGLQQKLFSLEGNRAAQLRVITEALIQQEAVIRRSASISKDLAAPSYQLGVRATSQGLRVPQKNAAGGYMPAVAKETADINRGVGGARSGDKPVVIPNFNFGGGKKGSIVAHTGEYAIPNFAGSGGTAIFNRDMVKKMGLPAGAKKINAAGGFIPNFQNAFIEKFGGLKAGTIKKQWSEFVRSNSGSNIEKDYWKANQETIDAFNLWKTSGDRSLQRRLKQEETVELMQGDYSSNVALLYPSSQEKIGFTRTKAGNTIKIASIVSKPDDFLYKELRRSFIDTSKNYVKNIGINPDIINDEVFLGVANQTLNEGTLQAAVGNVFETALQAASGIKSQKSNANFDILGQGLITKFAGSFGTANGLKQNSHIGVALNNIKALDFKNALNKDNIDSFDIKIKNAINSGEIKMSKLKNVAKGYIPNFANPLKEAINREMEAGVPLSQIYIDKNSSLKSASNPMGLMVANRKDEPLGGFQGINRAIKEGRSPQTYGASKGFVPNYADLTMSDLGTKSKYVASNLDSLNAKIKQLNDSISQNKISYDQAEQELIQFVNGIKGATKATQSRVSNVAVGKLQPAVEKQQKDFLGTIFAVQAGMSVLTGAFSDATSGVSLFVKRLADFGSSVTTAAFAAQGLKQVGAEGSKLNKVFGKIGAVGMIATVAYEGFNLVSQLSRDWTGVTTQANKATAEFTDAVNAAGVSLSSLSQVEQVTRKQAAKDVIYNISNKRIGGVGSEVLQNQIADFQLLTGITDAKEIKNILEKGGAFGSRQFLKTSLINEDKAPKVLADYLKSEEGQKRINALLEERKKKTEETNQREKESEQLNQTSLDLTKSRLQSELDLSIARQRGLDNLDKQKISAEILNNLSESQLDNLNYEIEKRDKIRESVDSVKSLIDDQISKLNGVVGKEKESEAIREKIANLTQEDYLNQDKVLKIVEQLQTIISKTPELRDAEKQKLQETLKILEAKRNVELKNLEINKQNVEQDKKRRDIVIQMISASNKMSATTSFLNTYSNTSGINANQLKINNLQSKLSRPGITNAETRAIENQIKALETNTAQLNRDSDILKELQQSKEKAISSLPENLKLNTDLINAINKALDAQEISNLLKSQGEYTEAMSNAAMEIEQSALIAKQTADFNVKLAEQSQNLTNVYDNVISASQKFALSLEEIPQKLQDLDFEAMTTTSGRRLAEISFEKETLRRQQFAKTPQEAAQIAKDRSIKDIPQLYKEAFSETNYDRMDRLNKSIVDSSVQFRDNLIDGITQAIESGNSLGDILRNAALEFARNMTKTSLQNAFSAISGGIGLAAGGPITGGSGFKDDVPAMLMGGEYVINKKAAQKYGTTFLNALNNGSISGYAKGGKVQKGGQGSLFEPGKYGMGAISGSRNLLDFASQTYTAGLKDKMISRNNFASIALEAESARLTNFGRRNGPQAEALRSAKEEAFGLYVQEYQAKQELKKQQKAQDKAFRSQLLTLALTAAGGAALQAGATGFGNAFTAAKGTGFRNQLLQGVKGIYTGAEGMGGLSNIFSKAGYQQFAGKGIIVSEPNIATNQAVKTGSTSINKSYIDEAINIASNSALDLPQNNINDTQILSDLALRTLNLRAQAFDVLKNKYNLTDDQARKFITDKSSNDLRGLLSKQPISETFAPRATGGSIPSTSGVDTVSAMLSGGEFIMNRAAAQNIGTGNLQALNSGAKSLPTEQKTEQLNDKLIAKLDELIQASGSSAGNITINVESSGRNSESASQSTPEEKQKLARQIRDAVIKVIQEEKRLGGQLRR